MTKVLLQNSKIPAVKSGSKSAYGNTAGGRNIPITGDPIVLTVWKKSLLMNCNGFTVYDARGNLIYRVDNYVAGNGGEIVLMDARGKPLNTIRRKRAAFGDTWMVYDGEKTADPRFSFRRNANFRNPKTLAQVISGNGGGTTSSPTKNVLYELAGSYAQRSVSVYDNARRCVAEIRPKEAAGGVALGFDVFRLKVVRPFMDSSTAMALVILMDQSFGSYSSYSAKRRVLR